MNKKLFWIVMLFLLSAGTFSEAQQPKKVPRVGFLTTAGQSSKEAFRQGLRELNYVEEKNIIIDYRQTEGKAERLNELAAELARLKPDVIVAGSTQDVLAAKNASSTTPIVMMTVGDPVASKLVDSLARPGGNITGVTSLSPDVNGKRLELLKETVPTLSRVGVLWNPQGSGLHSVGKKASSRRNPSASSFTRWRSGALTTSGLRSKTQLKLVPMRSSLHPTRSSVLTKIAWLTSRQKIDCRQFMAIARLLRPVASCPMGRFTLICTVVPRPMWTRF
jgi:ABC transporter substrate binding protein